MRADPDQEQDRMVFSLQALQDLFEADGWAQRWSPNYTPVDTVLVDAPGLRAQAWRWMGAQLRSVVGIHWIWRLGVDLTHRGQMPFIDWVRQHAPEDWRHNGPG